MKARFGLFLLVCLASSGLNAQVPFTEEASSRGLVYIIGGSGVAPWGYGLALVDLDGDLDPDLVLTGSTNLVGVFENDGTGHFTDRSTTDGIPPLTGVSGVIAGDYDNDGDLDLYFLVWHGANALYRNLGGLQFQVAALSSIGNPGPSTGSCWGDYDGDGRLDLYVSNYTGDAGSTAPNALYHNLGGGSFVDVAPALGVDNDLHAFQTVFLDYDRDADCDLYISNGKSSTADYRPNELFENVGGVFIDRTATSGADVQLDSMGVGIGDLDGNGYDDLYCTNVPWGHKLLLNQGDGTFTDSTDEAGVAAYQFGWGALILDLDNNGHADLYIAHWTDHNYLYVNQGQFPLEERAEEYGLAISNPTTCIAAGDVDNDGDLDLVLQNESGPIRLLINRDGELRNWLKVKLLQPGGNIHAIGATVEVVLEDRSLVRSVLAGEGYKAQLPSTVHFGLGSESAIAELRVEWPGGLTTVYPDVHVNQTVVVTPTEIFSAPFLRGDANHDLNLGLDDVIVSLDHLYGDGPSDCRDALDTNDDGILDLSDPLLLLNYLLAGQGDIPPPFPACGSDPTHDAAGTELGCRRLACP